jgi:hypothetical protein
MTTQRSLFYGLKLEEPELTTTVRLGRKSTQIPLRVGSYEAGGRHYWLDNLKLPRLQLDWHPIRYGQDPNYIPNVIVLWGSRSACVRIFTDYLTAVREQEYQGYWLYLLDFHNGFWQSPIDNHRSHCACLSISRFRD